MTTTFNTDYSQRILTINLAGASCCTQQTGPNVKRLEDQIMSTLPIAYASSVGIDTATLGPKSLPDGMWPRGGGCRRFDQVLDGKAKLTTQEARGLPFSMIPIAATAHRATSWTTARLVRTRCSPRIARSQQRPVSRKNPMFRKNMGFVNSQNN
ncbi:hypothetical protein [Paraburkholderia sp. DGU8]|jgi:hypothetical protein|uniref:hypothetical protein n=1 Tax=Paraburkholderia sp. DGU8 TaxID=3161997 RepID=UPI003466B909